MPDQCDHRDCTAAAIGIYEGIDPPAGTVRYAACRDHAPDAPAVKPLRPEGADV